MRTAYRNESTYIKFNVLNLRDNIQYAYLHMHTQDVTRKIITLSIVLLYFIYILLISIDHEDLVIFINEAIHSADH